MSKKRVPTNYVEDQYRLAEEKWSETISSVRDDFDLRLPPVEDRTYATKKMEKYRLTQAGLSVLRELGKALAGVVHESGNNTQEEKTEFKRINDVIESAKRMLKERGEES